jgi:hypothetical protein
MNVGSLFLSLGIKGDTKSLEDAIRKVEELKKQTQELNKALKEAKTNSNIGVSTSAATAKIKAPKESQVLREEAAVSSAKLRIAKNELGFLDLKEKKETKEEREQKKREKSREKATKDFFNQVEGGFSFIAKAFTGGLLAGGVAGYVTSQASKQVSLAASLQQYGIDPEKSQRYANVFRRASGGQVGDAETNSFIANLSEQIGQGFTTNPAALAGFGILGIDPSQIKDFESLLKSIREVSKNPNYKESNLTSLLGQLGVPKEFAPAFGKNFSDEQFNDAYNNAKISTNEQVEAAKKLNVQFAELGKAFDVLQGALLEKFAPALIGIANKIEEKLTPENIETATDVAKGIGAGYIATKAAKTAMKYGKAGLGRLGAVGAGGLGLYQGLSYLAERNEELYFPQKNKKRKENQKKEKEEYVADFGNFEVSDRLKVDSNRVYSQDEIAAAIKQTQINPSNNVSITVNINAGSVDKNTAPFIANEINSNVNKSLYNSKYPTLSVPK